MIKSIISVGGILVIAALFLYFLANPAAGLSLISQGFKFILEILGQLFSYLRGLF